MKKLISVVGILMMSLSCGAEEDCSAKPMITGTYVCESLTTGGDCGNIPRQVITLKDTKGLTGLSGCEIIYSAPIGKSCSSSLTAECVDPIDQYTSMISEFTCGYKYTVQDDFVVPISGTCSISAELWELYDNYWYRTDSCSGTYELSYTEY